MPLSGLEGVFMRQEIQWFVPYLSCMVFLSHLHWRGWAINWVYFALLHICVLQWLPTHHPKKKLCSRGSYSASTCRWNMLYGWSPLSTLHKKWLLLQIPESEKLFMGVSENSFLVSRVFKFLTCRMVWLRKGCCLCGWSMFHLNEILRTELFDSFSVAGLKNVYFSASVLETIRHYNSIQMLGFKLIFWIKFLYAVRLIVPVSL